MPQNIVFNIDIPKALILGVSLTKAVPKCLLGLKNKYQYLQIVENCKKIQGARDFHHWSHGSIEGKNRVQTLIRSLSRFSETTLMIFSGHVNADSVKIDPWLTLERLRFALRFLEPSAKSSERPKTISGSANNFLYLPICLILLNI